jgi:large subunit ribosomal protein L3
MTALLLGKKVGMTRVFDERGAQVPVTAIEAGPCYVSQRKTVDRDGYSALQLAFEDRKPRSSTMPLIGHDTAAGLSPKRYHHEFRFPEETVQAHALGEALTVDVFDGIPNVDVIGWTKGKGFQGVMKRWHFKGLYQTHGTKRKHRSPGSINGRGTNLGGGRPKKGIKMPGRMGNSQCTERSLSLVQRDPQRNLLLVKGPVPGAKGRLVLIREAVRLNKKKARALAEAEA